MSVIDKLTSARTALVLDEPFFGALVLSLKLVEDRTCKTAWVNGREIGYNPTFINSLTHSQIMGLLAHEVMHCASGHPWRRDGRNSKLWNIACDRAINNVLLDAGFSLPADGELASGDEVGKSAEWIANRMPKPGDNPESQPNESQDSESGGDDSQDSEQEGDSDADSDNGDSGDSDSGEGNSNELGDVRDAPTPQGDEDDTPTEEDWKQAVQQAAIQANAMGKLPGGLARLAGELVKPRADWRSILRRFIQTYSTSDYSWRQPNSRYVASGLYLPSLQSQELGEIAIAIDTSGSIDDVALAMAQAEVNEIISECKPSATVVYYCDSQIARVDEFASGEPITWNPCGGGGTDFRPVFADAEERPNPPVCLIYVTDLEGTFPEDSSIPTLWVTDGRTSQVPFGEVVPITD